MDMITTKNKLLRVLLCERLLDGHRKIYMSALIKTPNIECFALAPQNPGLPDDHFYLCSPITNRKSFCEYLCWIQSISNAVKKWNIDEVHFLDGDSIMRYFGIGFSKIDVQKKIITFHRFFNGYFRRVSYFCMNGRVGTTNVVHSEYVEKMLLNIGLKNVVRCDYPAFSFNALNNLDVSQCKATMNVPEKVPVIGIIGGCSSYKNIIPFLKAMQEIQDDFHILLAGKLIDISKEDIKLAIAPYKNKVTWICRNLSDLEYKQAIVASDIIYCIYGKGFNGSSGPLTDAVCAKKMVVACTHGTIGELTKKYRLGFLADATEQNQMIQCLSMALKNIQSFSYNYETEQYRESLKPIAFINKYQQIYLDINSKK